MKYFRNKGRRVKNCYFEDLIIEKEVGYNSHWFYPNYNNWMNDCTLGDCASWEDCHSLKAALRKIKRANVPKGTVFVLRSKYNGGYDIEIVKK